MIDADGRTLESWLWAAGDAVDPDVIHAVAGGHRVARSMMERFAVLPNRAQI
jgi:glutamate synthase (NADPH/NADH) small chain